MVAVVFLKNPSPIQKLITLENEVYHISVWAFAAVRDFLESKQIKVCILLHCNR